MAPKIEIVSEDEVRENGEHVLIELEWDDGRRGSIGFPTEDLGALRDAISDFLKGGE